MVQEQVTTRVIVRTLDGIALEEVPIRNLVYSFVLNGPGASSFILDVSHDKCTPEILAIGEREIIVVRNAAGVWGGYLWTANLAEEDKEMRFGCEGWFSRLNHIEIDRDLRFTGVEQFDIAWSLIEFAQERFDLGIRRGNDPPSGVRRTRTYNAEDRKKVGVALRELAAVINGFDFNISPDKTWRVYYPSRGRRAHGVVFELGKNVSGLGVEYDATKTVSEINAIGAGEGPSMLVSKVLDEDALAKFGLLQDSISHKDVSRIQTLQDHATEELRLRKDIRLTPQVSIRLNDPPFESYNPGDEVSLKLNVGNYVKINEPYRLISKVVAIGNAGNEVFTAFFDKQLAEIESVEIEKEEEEDTSVIVPPPPTLTTALVLSGGFASTPYHADYDISGPLDIRVAFTLNQWTGNPNTVYPLSRLPIDPSNKSWGFGIVQGDANHAIFWSTNGSNLGSLHNFTANQPPAGPGEFVLIRLVFRPNNGLGNKAVVFYRKSLFSGDVVDQLLDTSGFTQWGSGSVSSGTTTIHQGTSTLVVGNSPDNVRPMNGKILGAVWLDDIEGTPIAMPNFADQPVGTTQFTDDAGKEWTLSGAASIEEL